MCPARPTLSLCSLRSLTLALLPLIRVLGACVSRPIRYPECAACSTRPGIPDLRVAVACRHPFLPAFHALAWLLTSAWMAAVLAAFDFRLPHCCSTFKFRRWSWRGAPLQVFGPSRLPRLGISTPDAELRGAPALSKVHTSHVLDVVECRSFPVP